MDSKPIDWDDIAAELGRIRAKMVHDEGYRAPDFEAEALRRLFGYRAANDSGPDGRQRPLPYEHINSRFGLITQADADHLRESCTIVDRMNREKAEEQVKEMRAEVRRVYREAAADLAAMIRNRCNDRTVPSRYRREGVQWAADLIDPAVPKDRYGKVVRPTDTEAA